MWCVDDVQMKPEQERVKAVLTDTVALLCKNGLSYDRELRIQAVIGVTVDEDDVFIVHINEAFNAQGATSTSVSETSSSSMAVVPFGHQPKSEPVTPSSGVKRMRAAESLSPSGDAGRPPYAKQQLRFASPVKTAAVPGFPGSPPVSAGVNPLPRGGGGVSRGMIAAQQGGRMRGARRGASAVVRGRGFPAAARGLRGMSRGGRAAPAASGRPGVRGSARGLGRGRARMSSFPPPTASHDMKLSPGHNIAPPDSFSSRPGSSVSSHTAPAQLYDFNPYLSAAAAGSARQANSSTSLDDLPAFSTTSGDQGSFAGVNSVPPGFGFDSIFAADSSSSSTQAGSFADINPSVEFGFPPSFVGSDAVGGSGGFARSASSAGLQNATPASASGDVKTEPFNDDVIYVDDDVADAAATSTTAGGGGGDGDDGVSGAGLQQITRRVTITTNIQGQNVKYEQVRI